VIFALRVPRPREAYRRFPREADKLYKLKNIVLLIVGVIHNLVVL
jgi:hypothetical protein